MAGETIFYGEGIADPVNMFIAAAGILAVCAFVAIAYSIYQYISN